jgi:predicted RNA binding protein YcfA (HicA-like mRNA interferase family)
VYDVYYPSVTSSQVIARLKQDGWVVVNVRGSHHQFKHPNKAGKVTVPHPKKDLPKGTLRSIYRQAGWSWP